MARRVGVLQLWIALLALVGCDGVAGPAGPGDSVFVRITLRELPATLTFNQAHVPMSYSEYSWGIVFDTDGNGTFETDISLTHFKFSDTPEEKSLIEGTQHTVWEVIDTLGGMHGYARHQGVVVRIEPTAPTTLVLALPRSWPQIGRIDEQDRIFVRTTSYAESTPPPRLDFTATVTGTGVVTDAANDVGYGFIDIVAAQWSWTP